MYYLKNQVTTCEISFESVQWFGRESVADKQIYTFEFMILIRIQIFLGITRMDLDISIINNNP